MLNRDSFDWGYEKVLEDPECATIINKLHEMHNLDYAMSQCLVIDKNKSPLSPEGEDNDKPVINLIGAHLSYPEGL